MIKLSKTFIGNTEIEIEFASSMFTGYGHQAINVDIYCNGESHNFRAITSNMPAFDKANELEGSDKWLALYEIIERQIIDEVSEWIESL